jgi:predicted nucleic acid-binding protein
MKNFFLDTNIIVDVIANRIPFSYPAIRLFDYSEKGEVKLFISALSYSHIYYIVKKTSSHKEMMMILRDLEGATITLDVTKEIISTAVHTDFNDFEDAIQYHTALASNTIDAIITRDIKGYKKSRLAVLTPEEALGMIESV